MYVCMSCFKKQKLIAYWPRAAEIHDKIDRIRPKMRLEKKVIFSLLIGSGSARKKNLTSLFSYGGKREINEGQGFL